MGTDCASLAGSTARHWSGTPDQARTEVRYAIQHAAPGGGLVVTSGNVLQPGTQLANYLAARQATRDYGAYPIAVQ